MATKIESFKSSPDAKAVLSIELDNHTYYWFNTDATFFDGVEYIYDNQCEQVCYFCGECAFPDCTKNFPYDKTEWNILWMKQVAKFQERHVLISRKDRRVFTQRTQSFHAKIAEFHAKIAKLSRKDCKTFTLRMRKGITYGMKKYIADFNLL